MTATVEAESLTMFYPTLGLAGFVVAGILGIGLAIGVVRSGRL